jgi:hypothetical protein
MTSIPPHIGEIWDHLGGQPIVGVFGEFPRPLYEADAVHIVFENDILHFRVGAEFEDIHYELVTGVKAPNYAKTRGCRSLDELCMVGERIGWMWEAYNSQGYRDTMLIAFDGGIVPGIVFHVFGMGILAARFELERLTR